MRLLLLLPAALLVLARSVHGQGENAAVLKLEQDLLKNYNRKHRPVKEDSTALAVTILISITHIEKVNEDEQTAVIHGTMFASWKDEYLGWNSADYNGTTSIFLETWKIWQPALSLYNSARGNQWNLYMGGAPASIDSKGVVMSQGSFSFYVTCQFDFTNWPNDEHRCPIVIADWVYDLSRVNLSESTSNNGDMNPIMNLHYDPFDRREKKHVAGWEIVSTTRKHCYWGRKWCQESVTVGPGSDDKYEYYWSVLEFGVIIRRHAPYVIFTLVIPTILSSAMTLFSFWIDHDTYPLMLLVFNSIFQGLYGWDMVRQLPAGNGTMPDMIHFYGFNLTVTMLAIVFHILIEVLPVSIPKEIEMPEKLRFWASQIRSVQFFNTKGFSFDPAELYGDTLAPTAVPPSTISTLNSSASSALLAGFETTPEAGEILVQMEEGINQKPCSSSTAIEADDVPLVEVHQQQKNGETAVEMEGVEQKGEGKTEPLPPASTADHFALARRILFCLFAAAYLWELPNAFF